MRWQERFGRLGRPARAGLLATLLSLGGSALADEVVVIVNKANRNPVDATFLLRVYTGVLKNWPDGTSVIPLDQAEDSAARESFCVSVLGRSVSNLKAIWSQSIFTGKGFPPKIATPDAVMKSAVAANPQAIGYIKPSELDDSVRAVSWPR